MGVNIIVKDADFAYEAISYNAAVRSGLRYLNFFGKNKSTLARNLAPNMPQASVVGEPAIYSNAAGLGYLDKFVKTGVQQTKDATLIAVFAIPAIANSEWRHVISNFGRNNVTGGLRYGMSLSINLNAKNVRNVLGLVSNNGGSASSISASVAAALGSLVCVISRVDSSGRTSSIINKTTGASQSLTYAETLDPELNGEFLVGSAVSLATSAGELVTSFAAIYDRALGDDESEAMYASLKKFYSERGMSI